MGRNRTTLVVGLLLAGFTTPAFSMPDGECTTLRSAGERDMAIALVNLRRTLSDTTNVVVFGGEHLSPARGGDHYDARTYRVSGGQAPALETYINETENGLELCANHRGR